MADPLDELSSGGVSVWLDDLSRQRLTTGSLAGLVARDHVVGVTTNPTIFARSISGLEKHGLETFDTSWRELSDQLATALRCPQENHRA